MEHRIRVAAIILRDEKVLLVKHVHPETGYEWWVPPGGGIGDQDKSIFDCVKREVFEEVNLEIEPSKIVYIREYFDKENNKLNIEVFVLVDIQKGEVSTKNIHGKGPDELYIKDAKWFSKDEVGKLVVFPEILKDDFWTDVKDGFKNTRYLGRQE